MKPLPKSARQAILAYQNSALSAKGMRQLFASYYVITCQYFPTRARRISHLFRSPKLSRQNQNTQWKFCCGRRLLVLNSTCFVYGPHFVTPFHPRTMVTRYLVVVLPCCGSLSNQTKGCCFRPSHPWTSLISSLTSRRRTAYIVVVLPANVSWLPSIVNFPAS